MLMFQIRSPRLELEGIAESKGVRECIRSPTALATCP